MPGEMAELHIDQMMHFDGFDINGSDDYYYNWQDNIDKMSAQHLTALKCHLENKDSDDNAEVIAYIEMVFKDRLADMASDFDDL